LKTDLENLTLGKHLIQDENIFAICMEYETKDQSLAKNEAHKKYIDVQYMISGSEKMLVSGIAGLKITEEYDEENDVMFYENKCTCQCLATPKHFAIFFPEDAHTPSLNIENESNSVKKVVIKVAV
jgi:YhcH/YjgK/YiaL family protein